MISYEAVDASGNRIVRKGIAPGEWARHRSNLTATGYRFGYVRGVDDEELDGLPILRLAATSEDGSVELDWINGRWRGTSWARAIADLQTQAGDPLPLIQGFRPVTPEDGQFIYACAVMADVVGAGATWHHQLPPTYRNALLGEPEEGDDEEVVY